MNRKMLINLIEKKMFGLLASLVWLNALIAANSVCGGPYYEPKQPNELKSLKRFR